jgi:DNA-binding MarR family transcriptional regulator
MLPGAMPGKRKRRQGVRSAPGARKGAAPAAGADLPLDEGLQFMRVLWATMHALQKASKRMNRELGVTGPQRLVMRVIGLSPGLSAGRLAATLHLHPSTLTGVLQRLVRQGFISHGTDRRDRRRSVLHLTAAGERLNAKMTGTVEAGVRATLRSLPARGGLGSLASHLESAPARPRAERVRAAAKKR